MGTRTNNNSNSNINANNAAALASLTATAQSQATQVATAADIAPIAPNEEFIGDSDSYTLTGRTILSVQNKDKDVSSSRYTLELDGEPFIGYDANGTAIETNFLSIELSSIIRSIGRAAKGLYYAYVRANATSAATILNPEIVTLYLEGAKVDVKREHKTKGEQREFAKPGEVYARNLWKNTITKLEPFMDDDKKITLGCLTANALTIAKKVNKVAEEKPSMADAYASMY